MARTSPEHPPAPFVVGVARSGTTLLRMMLDAHSRLAIPEETNFGQALVAFEEGGPEAAVATMVASDLWPDYNLSADELAARVGRRRPAAFGDVARAFFELYAESRGKSRWGNKTPYYLARMTLIQEVLPEASFIHLVRDGRDVALSTVPLWFGPDDVAGVAREWSRMLTSARGQAPQLRSYVEVSYEDLVRDPAGTLQRLCPLLELEWEPSMLDYHRQAGERLRSELGDLTVGTEVVSAGERQTIHRLLDQPPKADRIGVWRREMEAGDLEAFEAIAGPTLEQFGYELS